MRKALFFAAILSISITALGQEKPLTQPEYVGMLMRLQKAPSERTLIVESLRRRGIDFVLTDGLRGLTRTKSRNDEELKRALEEAERRRANPEAAKLPSREEADLALDRTRFNSRQAVAEMPDFVVKQLITRSGAHSGTGNWRPYDNLVIAVSYSSEKGEQYKVLAKNGAPVDAAVSSSYSGLDGATSGGEFVEDLEKIFKDESKTKFELLTTDVVRGRPTLVFNYEIALENNKKGGVGLKGPVFRSTPAGEKGRIWIDRELFRVLKIEYQLTDIEPTFPVKAVTKSIDYDMVEISGEKYLLPIVSDFRGTVDTAGKLFDSRNVIRFRNYQKFGTDVIIVEEDTEPVPDEQP